MTALDATLAALFALAALIWLAGPTRRLAAWLIAPTAALAVWSLMFRTFTWQFVPLYAGVGLLIVLALRRRAGRLGGAALIACVAASWSAWAVLAVPDLPRPHGPYPVGTITWRWVDAARPEDVTDAPGDRRGVVAQVWYPAQGPAGSALGPYMDGVGRLPPSINGLPRFIFRRFDEADTHAAPAAPVSAAHERWPVILFSPGYGAPRAAYSGLVADLASRGFAVVALDHPYEGPATQLADGRIAQTIERFIPGDPDRTRYMETRLATRVGDLGFVLDELARRAAAGDRLAARLDLTKVAVVGHSFGGAAAAAFMSKDKRPIAGADLDGMLYGQVERADLARPFLFIESDHAVTRHSPLYLARRDALLAPLGARAQTLEIKGANHYSFTDVEAFLAPPARPLLRRLLGGSTPAVDVQRRAADRLEAFLSQPRPASAASPAVQLSENGCGSSPARNRITGFSS